MKNMPRKEWIVLVALLVSAQSAWAEDPPAQPEQKQKTAPPGVKRAKPSEEGAQPGAKPQLADPAQLRKLGLQKSLADRARGAKPEEEPGAPDKAKAASEDPERADRLRRARRQRFAGFVHRVGKPEEIPPAVRQELRHHARRIAKLERIAALAKEKSEERVSARVEKLIARENARHQAKMARFWPEAPKGAPTSPEEDELEGDGEEIDPEAAEEGEEEQP